MRLPAERLGRMDPREILALYDREMRIEIEFPNASKDAAPRLVRYTNPLRKSGTVLYSRLAESEVDEAIQRQVESSEKAGYELEWKVYDHDTPADLLDRLSAKGFAVDGPEAIMALDLERVPAVLLAPVRHDVQRILTPEGLVTVAQLEHQIWDEDLSWIVPQLGQDLQIPGYLSIYVGFLAGAPASAGWIYFHTGSHFASLWGGSTLEGYRNRGLYTAVLATRVQEAMSRGFRFVTIDASPMSRPIVEALGFRLLSTAHACRWRPPGVPSGAAGG